MTMKKIAVPLAVLVLAFAVGCGDDDGDSGGENGGSSAAAGNTVPVDAPLEPSSLSKAQWVKRANAICERTATKRLDDLTAYAEDHADESEEDLLVPAAGDVIIPSLEDQVEALRELGAPRGDEEEIERIIRAYALVPAAARKEDDSLNNAEVGLAIVRARNAGRKYDLTACNFK